MKVPSRSIKFLALLLGFTLVVAACGSSSKGSKSTKSKTVTTVASNTVKDGGKVTFALEKAPLGWNPNDPATSNSELAYITQLVYPQAYIQQPDFTVKLDRTVVDSAEQTSDSPQTIVYKINPKAVWSDGVPISFDDFEFTKQIQDGKTFPKASVASTTGYDQIKSLTGSDGGKTVTVVFAKPFAEWQSLWSPFFPKHLVKDVSGWNTGFKVTNPPTWSGGPYRFANLKGTDSIELVRNEKYWATRPHLDKIIVRFQVETGSLAQGMENKEIDLGYPQPQIDILGNLKNVQGIKTQITFGLSFEHLDFNLDNPLLADKAVRQAIAYGLDRDDLVRRTVAQFDSRAKRLDNRMFVNNQKEYEAHGQQYAKPNPTMAAKVLTDAGYVKGSDGIWAKAGKKLSFRITTTGGNKLREDTESVIRNQLQKIGIKVTNYNLPGNDAFDRIFAPEGKNKDFDLGLYAWVSTPFPSINASIYQTKGGQNDAKDGTNYSNKAVDAIITQALTAKTLVQAVTFWNQADVKIWEDVPTIPLYQKPTLLPYRDTVLNVVDNATTQGPLWNAVDWGFAK